MNKYLRLLVFGKPYIRHFVLVMLLAYLYIFFNMSTFWYSADFFQTIFLNPKETATQSAKMDAPKSADAPKQTDASKSIGTLLIPKASITTKIKTATDRIVTGRNKKETLFRVCVILFVCFVLKNIVVYFKGILMGFIELQVVTDIRNRLYSHLMKLPLGYFNNKKSGDITSIMINDVGVINNVINTSFRDFVLVPSELLVQLVALCLISWRLTVMIFIIIPVLALIIIQIGNSIRRKSKRTLLGISSVVDCLQEVIPNIKIVKAYVTEKKEVSRFQQLNHIFFKLSFRQKKLQNLTSPINETIGVCLAVYLLWYGGNQVLSGKGLESVMFVRYLVFLFAMFQPLRQLSGLNNTIQTGIAAGERVYEILNETSETDSGKRTLDRFDGSIRFEDVAFRYAPNLPYVLDDIRLEIRKGDIAAFVGPSGAGKTTLVNLIPRFFEAGKGRILIDGTDIREFTLASLRRQISVVTQETILFNMSIAENIAYCSDTVDMGKVEEAARVAHAEGFVLSAPQSYRTVVGERGVRLSGGQKQRISIARAMLKNTPILILDEATSSLDTESEKLVQEAIDSLMKNRTVLVIAHRLSTVMHADKIVVLDHGRILDMGPHRQLLKTCPLYKKLYDIQFRDA
jgi:subfamily B ATP-binding cassette protein MsbA